MAKDEIGGRRRRSGTISAAQLRRLELLVTNARPEAMPLLKPLLDGSATSSQIEGVQSLLLELLVKLGTDEDGEVTALGRQIDELIGALSGASQADLE